MSIEQDLHKIASDAYYLDPNMVKFLLIENLAIKSLLHDKGLMTPEEFKEQREKAESVFEERAKMQLVQHLKHLSDKDDN